MMSQLFTFRSATSYSPGKYAVGWLMLLMALLSYSGMAQSVIWTNPITGSSPSSTNPYLTGQSVAPGITVSGIGRTGVNPNTANDRYNTTNWPTGSIDLGKYFSFTITPQPGTRFTLSSIIYSTQVSTGTPSLAIRTSVDNYGANIGTPTLGTNRTVSFSGAGFENQTGPITVRFYVFNISAAGTTFSINDFSFSGTVLGAASTMITSTSGSGSTVTHTFTPTPTRSTNLFSTSDSIAVTGFTPSGYNTTAAIVSGSTTTTVQYANATTSAVTVFGSVASLRTFTGMDYNNGGPSAARAVRASVTGINPATATMTVYAPENGAQFEVSTTSSSSGFGSTATFSAASALADATVWVRAKAGLAAGTYTGNVGLMGGNMNTPTMTVTGASGNGTTATLTFATQASAPYAVGDVIVVSAITPSGYNGAYTVTASSTNSVSFASTETGVYSSGGTINRATTLATVSGTVVIGCTAPTQASALVLSAPTVNGLSASWTSNGGDGTMIVVRPTAQSNATPTNGTTYTANTDYALAGQINTNNRVIFRSSGTSTSVTEGLAAETQYTVSAYAYNNSGDCYALAGVPSANLFTLSLEPSAHPASFTVSGTTPTSLTLGFSAANTLTNCDGYLLLRRNGLSAPTGLPTDATAYSVTNTIGDGTLDAIITNTAQTSIVLSSLTPGTDYSYLLIPFNWNGSTSATYNYLTSGSPLTLSGTTNSVSVPVVTSATKTSFTTSSAVLGGNVTSDGGDALTFRGIAWSYTDNTPEVGEAGVDTAQSTVSTGVFTRTLSGLNASSRIYFRAYATNSQGTGYTATDSFSTLALAPTTAASALTIGARNETTLVLTSVTHGNGANRVLVVRPSASTRVAPTNGVAYTASSLSFTDGLNPTTGTNNVVVANGGSLNNLTITGLTANTNYAFDVYELNGAGDSTHYFYDVTASISARTLATEPTTAATNVTFTAVSPTQATINWTAGNGANHLVVVRAGSAVNGIPVDGTIYTANAAFGSGTAINTDNFVVYRATLNQITVTGLTEGTTYHVAVYTYNGTAGQGSENYLTTTPATGSVVPVLETYYSVAGQTNPGSLSSWNTATDGSGSAPASFTANALRLVIQNGHSMTTTGTWLFGSAANSELRIATGGTLTASHAITINNAASIFRIDSAGTYVHNNTGTPSTTIFNGVENFHAASNFNLNNWNSNNTAITTGVTLPYGNLTINWTGNTNNWQNGMSGTFTLAAGNLVFTSVGSSGSFRFAAGTSYTITVGGNLIINASLPIDLASSANASTSTLNIGGKLTVASGSTLTRTGSVGTGGPVTIQLQATSDTLTTLGTVTSTSINWNILAGDTYTHVGSLTIPTGRTFTVNGTYLPSATTVLSGAGSVIINGAAKISHANGIGGNITAATRTFNAGANLSFNGNSDQITGHSGITLTNIDTLVVENTSGVVTQSAVMTLGNGVFFTILNGATYDFGTQTTSFGTSGIFANYGTIRTQNTNGLANGPATSIVNTNSPSVVLGTQSTVVYNASSANQTIDSRADYQFLAFGGTGSKNLSGDITIANDRSLTVDFGTTLNLSSYVMSLGTNVAANINGGLSFTHASGFHNDANSALSTTNSPAISLGPNSTINFAATTGTQTVDARADYANLTLSGGANKQAAGDLSIQKNMVASGGSFLPQSFLVTFNGTTGQLIDGNINFHNLNIENETTIPSGSVTVSGILNPSLGDLNANGNLTMVSNATNQAIVDFSGAGSVLGNVIAQRYVSGINNAWRGFSAPVASPYSDISGTVDLGTQGQNGANLITLRDMDFWTGVNWQKASNWRIAADTNINATLGGIITAGRGFLAYGGTSGVADLSSPVTLDLTGALNSTTISAPGLVSSNRPYNGWMLMGNPYLATLDWESMYGTADVANLNATIYLFNTTSGSWDSYNAVTNTSTGSGTNLIAPFQAFMVKASSATVPTLNFRTSQTSTSASTYNMRQQNNFPIVRLHVKKNNVQVQTALTLIAAQATAGLDADYDAQYPGSFNGHDFYSMTTGDYKLQQNSRPMPATGISEPYYFEHNGTGNYSIASTLENIDPMWNVYLEDKITGAMHNLRTSAYNFSHQATNRKDRFVLHINALTTSVNEVSNDNGPIVAMQNGTLNVRFSGAAASRKLEVVDLSGKVLRTVVMENATAAEIDLSDFAQAVYLLRATGNGSVSVTKFVNVR